MNSRIKVAIWLFGILATLLVGFSMHLQWLRLRADCVPLQQERAQAEQRKLGANLLAWQAALARVEHALNTRQAILTQWQDRLDRRQGDVTGERR